MVLFTSGTTSVPRGAVLSHRSLLGNLQNLLALARRLPGPDESTRSPGVTLMTMPLFHIGGIQQLFTALVSGSTLVFLDDRFSPAQVLGLIGDEGVTSWAAVPTMVSRVLDEYESDPSAYDVSTLRAMVIGGSPVVESLRNRAREVFPSTRGGQGASYGLTEISGVAATAAGQAVAERPGTVGQALPTVDLRIDGPDDRGAGEVQVRSPGSMIGYWGAPDDPIFTPDRWLRTGDLGRLDDEGYLYIEGRAKDVVIRGGENIAPLRVEDRLLEHRCVAEVAVVGLPHAELGEELAAAVVLYPGVTVSESELAAFAAERLAYFAVPTAWWFVSELPQNAAGKVLKKQIAARWPVEASPR
jgi:long-chain acyl-CoA synthetase